MSIAGSLGSFGTVTQSVERIAFWNRERQHWVDSAIDGPLLATGPDSRTWPDSEVHEGPLPYTRQAATGPEADSSPENYTSRHISPTAERPVDDARIEEEQHG